MKALFFVGVATVFFAGFSHSQEQANPIPQNAVVQSVSEEEFQKERAFMIEDLGNKLSVMNTARNCAKGSADIETLRQCWKNLQIEAVESTKRLQEKYKK